MLTFVLASSSSTFPKKESYGSEKRREVIVEARARVYNNILKDQAVFSACEAKFKFCRSFCFFWNWILVWENSIPKPWKELTLKYLFLHF